LIEDLRADTWLHRRSVAPVHDYVDNLIDAMLLGVENDAA